MYLLEKKNKI